MAERARWTAAALWSLALVLMLAAAVWQRLSGPTHPRVGRSLVAGESVRWRLLRSGTSGEPLVVAITAPQAKKGAAHFRRFPMAEPFRSVELAREGEVLAARLPSQPPAGKLEYFVTLDTRDGAVRIPEGEPVVARFKGEVPALVLVPHVILMFFSMLIGIRAALAALLGRAEARRYAWVTLAGITLGGMVLGPIVQKLAFGAYWTGWPLGKDLTDDKTAFMWLAWMAALLLAGRRAHDDRVARAGFVLAALVMLGVYLVPHSLRGSQLDHARVDAGARPEDAVTTGR